MLMNSFQEAGQLEFSFAADAGGGVCAAYHIGYDGTTGQFTFSVSAQDCFGVGKVTPYIESKAPDKAPDTEEPNSPDNAQNKQQAQAKNEKANLLVGVKEKPPSPDLESAISVGMFAGMKAGCAITGSVLWSPTSNFKGAQYVVDLQNLQHPEYGDVGQYNTSPYTTKPTDLSDLISLKYKVEVDAGVGHNSALLIHYNTTLGQFTISVSSCLCFGIGWGGAFSAVIGKDKILEMIKFIYQQLQLVNFDVSKLCSMILDESGYHTLSKLIVVAIWAGDTIEKLFKTLTESVEDAIKSAVDTINDIISFLSEDYEKRQAKLAAAVMLAQRINNNTEALNNITPSAKGHMLYHLSQYDPLIMGNYDEVQEAVINVIKAIVNASEFIQVLTSMVDYQSTNKIPLSKGAFMLRGTDRLFFSTTYGANLSSEIYRMLAYTDAQYLQSTDIGFRQDLRCASQILKEIIDYLRFSMAIPSSGVLRTVLLANSGVAAYAAKQEIKI